MIHIKIKQLLPSLRPRKRYLVYEVLSEHPVKDADIVQRQIWHDCHNFLGDYGMSKLCMKFFSYNSKSQRGIIRLTHTGTTALKAALLFVQRMEKEPVIVRSIAVSGTLKKTLLHQGG